MRKKDLNLKTLSSYQEALSIVKDDSDVTWVGEKMEKSFKLFPIVAEFYHRTMFPRAADGSTEKGTIEDVSKVLNLALHETVELTEKWMKLTGFTMARAEFIHNMSDEEFTALMTGKSLEPKVIPIGSKHPLMQ